MKASVLRECLEEDLDFHFLEAGRRFPHSDGLSYSRESFPGLIAQSKRCGGFHCSCKVKVLSTQRSCLFILSPVHNMTTTNAPSQPDAQLLSQKPFPLQKQRFSAPPYNLASTFRTVLLTTSSSSTINRVIDNNVKTFSATVYLSRHALFHIHRSYRLPAEHGISSESSRRSQHLDFQVGLELNFRTAKHDLSQLPT